MSITIDISPRVREIIDEAIAQAKPMWLGYMLGDVEVHSRLPIYLVEETPNVYRNANWIQTDPSPCDQDVDGCCLASEKTGP